MSDDSDSPPVPDDCEGPQLENLAQTRRALAAACRLIKAGKLPADRAGNYVNALTALCKAQQDARDSLWTKRASVLWTEREKAMNGHAAAPH